MNGGGREIEIYVQVVVWGKKWLIGYMRILEKLLKENTTSQEKSCDACRSSSVREKMKFEVFDMTYL